MIDERVPVNARAQRSCAPPDQGRWRAGSGGVRAPYRDRRRRGAIAIPTAAALGNIYETWNDNIQDLVGSRLRRAAANENASEQNVTELTIVQLVSLGLAAIACGWDLRTRRIRRSSRSAARSPAWPSTSSPVAGRADSAASLVGSSASSIFLAPFALGGLGAGDVKLLGALGAWLGATQSDLACTLHRRGRRGHGACRGPGQRVSSHGSQQRVRVLMMHWRLNGPRPLAEVTLEHARGPRLAYAVPILAGTVATLWLQ